MAEDVLENGSSRGEFLARGAGIAGLAVGAGVWAGGLAQATEAEAASDSRSYVSGHFALELDGILIGLLKKMEGGDITAEVAEIPGPGGSPISKKHIGNIKYDDFTLQCGFSMSKAIYDWINGTWSGKAERRDGAVARRRLRLQGEAADRVRRRADQRGEDPRLRRLREGRGVPDAQVRPGSDEEQGRQGQARQHDREKPEAVASVQLQVHPRRPADQEGLEDRQLHDQAGNRDRVGRRHPGVSEGAGEARVPEPEDHVLGDGPSARGTPGSRTWC